MAEMAKTEQEAMKMTEDAEGKHHIGDFLPSGELDKFMNKYKVQPMLSFGSRKKSELLNARYIYQCQCLKQSPSLGTSQRYSLG